ncbi:hypothetical protein [Aciditerrimonas ferrireducens]|uniref:hypothetical protein n=1 Tax=Aciditerrimonas ferrireducens TaxID=667306 RepID=UPI002005A925|nr:hypothetical protein [Aciditerrimonas ferrireducens]MCK4175954.1 hypothetical protein [Aciditerrimonas ferrireducens]
MSKVRHPSRRRVRRIGMVAAAGGLGGALVAGLAGPAFAGSDAAMNVNVTNATLYIKQPIKGMPGYCNATLTADVFVYNMSKTTETFQQVYADVTINNSTEYSKYDPTRGSAPVEVTFVSSGNPAFKSGTTLAAGTGQTYDGVEIAFPAPCTATGGDVAIGVTDQFGSGSGDAPFQFHQSTIPVGAVGAVGVTALAAGGLGIVTWRRRREQARQEVPTA